jgi:hypothetical protein
MQIQVNTDNHIEGNADLIQQVHDLLADKLRRFGSRITRIEAHFTDENSSTKSGDDDVRCLLEARLSGLDPLSISDRGPSLLQALSGAIGKLQSALDTVVGKLESRRGGASS